MVNLCRRHFALSLSRKSLAALRCQRGSCCVYNFPLASSAKIRITETVDSAETEHGTWVSRFDAISF